MPSFNSRAIMVDGVAAIKESILSTGWNPVSEIVGFISEEEQITAILDLKKAHTNKDTYELELKKYLCGKENCN